MSFRIVSAMIVVTAANLTTSGCNTLLCKKHVSHEEIMNSWVGADLEKYERQNRVRPFATMPRPRNRTEYSYVTHDEWIQNQHYKCTDRLIVDNATGKIVSWSYEGTHCVGYCER